jgi:hypothetical protein
MNPIGPEVSPTQEHYHFGGSLTNAQERFAQTLTLLRAHGSIVKRKMQVPYLLPFFIPDLTVSPSIVGKIYRDRNFWDMG